MKRLQGRIFIICLFISGIAAGQATDAKMKTFVDGLMKRMTLEEKIGQLNLLTPGGGVATGAVVSSDVETKIKAGTTWAWLDRNIDDGNAGMILSNEMKQNLKSFHYAL